MRCDITASLFASLLLVGMTSYQVRAQTRPSSPTTETSSEATRLPVRRVVLYKNGVGYFEHLGRVRDNQEVTIDFTSAQLDDVLKSLTILDLDKGSITGVDYNSEAPLSRRLGELRLPVGEKPSLTGFLRALGGARLEVRTPAGAVRGRLLSVEKKTRREDGGQIPVDELTLVTEAGAIRTLDLGRDTSVRILDSQLKAQVSRYLVLLASAREQDLRHMTITTAGQGLRRLYVSYISEVPVWKTTYRLVLPSKPGQKPLLQGWAVVDNTVGEDWENVQLSLVAGSPQSFIQQLSKPYYARRPVVSLPTSLRLTPQTHQAGLISGESTLSGRVTDPWGQSVPGASVDVLNQENEVIVSTLSGDDGRYEIHSLPSEKVSVKFSLPGFQTRYFPNMKLEVGDNKLNSQLKLGEITQMVTVTAGPETPRETPPPGTGSGSGESEFRIEQARRESVAAARGRELGDLFEYKLKEPVTIHKNQSALVPILQTEIEVEKVSLWTPSRNSPRPLRALWLSNNSPLTLDRGSFSVLQGETFAGEGLLEPIKAGERRLLSYAADLGLLVDSRTESRQEHVSRVLIGSGALVQKRERHRSQSYTVRNQDSAARSLIIEHPRRAGWKLSAENKPEETTTGFYRFRMQVEPKTTAHLTVNEARTVDTRNALADLDEDHLALFVRQGSINSEIEQALRRILQQKAEIGRLAAAVSARKKDIERIFDDQKRIRENMKALKGSREEKGLTQRYTRQLTDQEKRLQELRTEMSDLESRHRQAKEELNRVIEKMSMDVVL